MPWNFSFVIDGHLAGMAHPGHGGPIQNALQFLTENEIRAIVSLTEDPLNEEAIRMAGMDYLHLPVADFTPPSLEQVQTFVDFVRERSANQQASVVHCHAGMGRTGTMLACYLVSENVDPEDAIREVRTLRPGSIETAQQEALVRDWAKQASS